MSNCFKLLLFLCISILLFACEEECESCDCSPFNCTKRVNSTYVDLNTSLSFHPNAVSNRDSAAYFINNYEENLSLNLLFKDSTIDYKIIGQKVPFYLKFNSLYASEPLPTDYQTFYFTNDKIDSINVFLQLIENDSIKEEIYFSDNFNEFFSSLDPAYQNSYPNFDSLLNFTNQFVRPNERTFIDRITCSLPLSKIKSRGRVRFRTEVIINSSFIMNDTSKVIITL